MPIHGDMIYWYINSLFYWLVHISILSITVSLFTMTFSFKNICPPVVC